MQVLYRSGRVVLINDYHALRLCVMIKDETKVRRSDWRQYGNELPGVSIRQLMLFSLDSIGYAALFRLGGASVESTVEFSLT